MEKSKLKVLSIFRESYELNRGTPIRVRNIIKTIATFEEFDLYTATKDPSCDFSLDHLELDNLNFKNLLKLKDFVKSKQINIVIFHTMSSALYALPLKILLPFKSYKTVLEMHGFLEEEAHFNGNISFFKYYFKKLYFCLIYKSIDLVITCSQTAADIIGKYNKNTLPIYGGIFLPDAELPIKVKKGNTGQISIGYSGNNRGWQGLDFLIAAFKVLRKTSENFKLNLMLSKKKEFECIDGINYFSSGNQQQASEFNLDNDILVIPRLKNKVNEISFPSKLFDYLHSGNPVVASDVGDLSQILRPGEDILLFKPGDTEDFLRCIKKLEDNEFRTMIGTNGRKVVLSKFNWKVQGSLLKKSLLSVVNH